VTPMTLRPNAGFLPALIAGKGECKGSVGPITAPRTVTGPSSPVPFPATKAERDTFDLRLAWPTFAPAGRPEGEAGEGGADEDTDDLEPLTEDEVKNPRLKKLSDEAAKRRNQAKAEKERADAAEARLKEFEGQANTETLLGQLREGQMENAFLKMAFGKVADVDAAWKLADKAGVTITNEGTVEGLDEVLAKVLEKHPYLTPKPAEQVDKELADRFPALTPSGRPNNGRKNDKDAVDYSVLEKKFPALRRGR
jgi:hypothetical protein